MPGTGARSGRVSGHAACGPGAKSGGRGYQLKRATRQRTKAADSRNAPPPGPSGSPSANRGLAGPKFNRGASFARVSPIREGGSWRKGLQNQRRVHGATIAIAAPPPGKRGLAERKAIAIAAPPPGKRGLAERKAIAIAAPPPGKRGLAERKAIAIAAPPPGKRGLAERKAQP